MEAESRYTYVGAAVLALVVALILSVLWLKNIGGRNFEHYAIAFEQQALDGLDLGASVSLRGIQIGRVEDYALSGKQGNAVRVEIRVDRRVPVLTSTVAVVTRNLLTGIASIALVNREPAGEPLTAIPDGETVPVIAEGQSDLAEIAGRVNRVGEMASDALGSISELLNEKNRQSIVATIENLRDLSAGLKGQMVPLQQSMATVADAASQAAVAVRQAGTAASELGRSGDRIAGVVEKVGSRVDTTLAQADRALADTQKALQQVATAVDAVQAQAVTTAQRLETTAAGVDDQLRSAVSELRLGAETTARSIEQLRDPRASLLGPPKNGLGPGESLK
ncbi:MAG: MlaD family protein [Rubrivivax sp.]